MTPRQRLAALERRQSALERRADNRPPGPDDWFRDGLHCPDRRRPEDAAFWGRYAGPPDPAVRAAVLVTVPDVPAPPLAPARTDDRPTTPKED
jgi:hypothetical protein